ncbi:MAG: undecaprenyldiphospho-muramoylpentapeptide beta-N-acetylglucosaminyltransferase [Solirubrobacteraceae bacterium]
MRKETIVIAAGGTAGHVVPALAVADALRDEGAEVQFIGGERAEATLVPEAGFQLHQIAVEGLSRSNPLRAARALTRSAGAVLAARRILAGLQPDAVLGGGGYVAGPVGLAALSMRTPLLLSEADSHLGLTNRLLAPWARRVCLSFAIAGREGPRYLVSGRPVPAVHQDRQAAREALQIAPDELCLLVFGGSLGARSINLTAIDAFADVAYHVLHICGRRDYPELSARARPAHYDLREYMDTHDFSGALSAADLVLARAGGSVFEVAAHGLPAILVPYPHASADHQSTNARWMEQAGAAIVIADADLQSQRLKDTVDALLGDPGRLREMARASLALARPEAASLIASELLKAAGR